MIEEYKIKIHKWMSKHGINLDIQGEFDKPISDIEDLDSLLVMALIIEIEDITQRKVPNDVLINSNQISINQLIISTLNE
jgi:biotin-(acetyl-CoA carboxylase) ligase